LVVALATVVVCVGFGAAPAFATAPRPPTLEAWIYPSGAGQPACSVPTDLSALAADPLDVLKPEYLVASRGTVQVEDARSSPCNGFSAANLAHVRTAAHHVYVTVSAGTSGAKTVLKKPVRRAAAEQTIESFVATNGIDGVDLDFEPNRWSAALWVEYMDFVGHIASALAPQHRVVEVDMQAWTATPSDASRYAGPVAAGARLVVMAYDHEYDIACAPITPYSWLQQVVRYSLTQVPNARLTVGIPSYGYTTTTCQRVAGVTSNVAYVTMEHAAGFSTDPAVVAARRDAGSGEIRWASGTTHYDYVDATALDAKLQTVEALGVTDVSVWSLGGEPWFTGNPG
jgi:spore germination protein YaaH